MFNHVYNHPTHIQSSDTRANLTIYLCFASSMSAATTAESYTVLSYTSPSLYTATLTNLPTGNKEYFYSCGSDQLGYSPVQSFKTHPGMVEDVTFFVLGDVGQTSNSANTINELVEYEALLSSSSGGIISMGDLSYANGKHSMP
jgi:hypothetical protein